MGLTALGLVTRPAMLVGVLAHAQLGALNSGGDRAIDRIIRMVLLMLIFTNAHRCFALGDRLRRRPRTPTSPGWFVDLLHLLMVLLYMSAGMVKAGASSPGWFTLSGPPELYFIFIDPTAGRISWDSELWRSLWPALRVAGYGTVLMELTAFLLPTRWSKWCARHQHARGHRAHHEADLLVGDDGPVRGRLRGLVAALGRPGGRPSYPSRTRTRAGVT